MTLYRSGGPLDASALMRFLELMHTAACDKTGHLAPVDRYATMGVILACMREGFCELAINEDKRHIVGAIGAVPMAEWWGTQAILRQVFLYVDSTHAGRAFVAKRLIGDLMTFARERMLPVAMGDIAGDASAKRMKFYERLGFTPVGANFYGA